MLTTQRVNQFALISQVSHANSTTRCAAMRKCIISARTKHVISRYACTECSTQQCARTRTPGKLEKTSEQICSRPACASRQLRVRMIGIRNVARRRRTTNHTSLHYLIYTADQHAPTNDRKHITTILSHKYIHFMPINKFMVLCLNS